MTSCDVSLSSTKPLILVTQHGYSIIFFCISVKFYDVIGMFSEDDLGFFNFTKTFIYISLNSFLALHFYMFTV